MNVIDFLKEKSDRLARNRDELIESFKPREYLNEAMNQARNSQWLSWALDQKTMTSGSDTQSSDSAWPCAENPQAMATLSSLSQQLNQINFIGEWLSVDQTRIDAFAEVTGDHQWIHTDPLRAKEESPFGDTVSHGFLTLSLIPKLTGAVREDADPFPGAKMVVNVGLNKVRYLYPVKVGSNIRATKKVIEVKAVRRGLEITEEVTIEIEGVRRPACVAQTVALAVY